MRREVEEVVFDPADPYPWFRFMRANHPVYYDEQFRMWYVFSYENAQRILLDSQSFSSRGATGGGLIGETFLAMDPPEHQKYRTLVNQAFTPARVARLEPRMAAIVNEMLDAVVGSGQMDVIGDLSYPFPAIVIAELLGVPTADRNLFKTWADEIVAEYESHTQDQNFAAQDALAAYLLPLVEQRSRAPQDDLISALLAAEVDGERLTRRDILATAALLLTAGHQTTMHLIGNAMYAFTEFSGVLDELRADPSLIPDAIEEVLRFWPPVSGDLRVVVRDTRIADTDVPAGSFIVPNIAAANRDERVFPDPDRFDIRRRPVRHFGFGHGVHFCLGAPLARLEARVAVTIMLERLPELRRAPDSTAKIVMRPAGLFQNTERMPISFAPQTPRG